MAGRPPGSGQAPPGWVDDPRREARRRRIRVPLPEGVDARELDAEVRRDLRSLAKDTAELVAQHLVVTGQLLDTDPEQALLHARAAAALAGRVGAVREAAGLAAYAAGEWTEAVAELRTARRITGEADHLGVIADCERALGRPERAVALLLDPDVAGLGQAARVELSIVVAGARRDLGEADAAVLLLQAPARATTARHPWAARLWYAYADALLAAGRDEAREWFERVTAVDPDGDTDAEDRLLELDGVVFQGPTTDEDEDQVGPAGSVSLAELGLDATDGPVSLGLEQVDAAGPEQSDAAPAPTDGTGDVTGDGKGDGTGDVTGKGDGTGDVTGEGVRPPGAVGTGSPAFSHPGAETGPAVRPEPVTGQQDLFSDLPPPGGGDRP